MRRAWLAAHLVAIAGVLAGAGTAQAHGFGQRYDLPIPLPLYLAGAGAVVGFSLVLAALFLRAGGAVRPRSGRSWSGIVPLVPLWQGLTVAALALVVAAGLFGNQDPFKNLAPLSVWVVGWVALSLLCGFLGDIWTVINPWKALHAWVVPRIAPRLARDRPRLRWPTWLGAWPGVFLFLGFAWCELLWEDSDHPRALAWLIIAYSLLTWAGMTLFGRRRWLAGGEFFAIAFGLLARFGCVGIGGTEKKIRWRLRLPASGLLSSVRLGTMSQAAFLLTMLATVTFDGLSETPAWAALLRALQPGGGHAVALATLGLVLLPFIFSSAFVATVFLSRSAAVFLSRSAAGSLSRSAAGATQSLTFLVCSFVPALVPIALAYHLAHNLAFLLLGLQYLVPILSDPFGVGWDLFGTKLYFVDISVVNAQMLWFVAIGVIVIGHVIAVTLAHVIALRLFTDRLRALRSQVPMIVLMVGYTMTSLWILAQPITNARAGG